MRYKPARQTHMNPRTSLLIFLPQIIAKTTDEVMMEQESPSRCRVQGPEDMLAKNVRQKARTDRNEQLMDGHIEWHPEHHRRKTLFKTSQHGQGPLAAISAPARFPSRSLRMNGQGLRANGTSGGRGPKDS